MLQRWHLLSGLWIFLLYLHYSYNGRAHLSTLQNAPLPPRGSFHLGPKPPICDKGLPSWACSHMTCAPPPVKVKDGMTLTFDRSASAVDGMYSGRTITISSIPPGKPRACVRARIHTCGNTLASLVQTVISYQLRIFHQLSWVAGEPKRLPALDKQRRNGAQGRTRGSMARSARSALTRVCCANCESIRPSSPLRYVRFLSLNTAPSVHMTPHPRF